MALLAVVVLGALAVGWGTGWFGLGSDSPLAATRVPSELPSRGVQLDDGGIVLTPWATAHPRAMSADQAIAAARPSLLRLKGLPATALKAELTTRNGIDHVPVWLVTYSSPKPIDLSGDGIRHDYLIQFSEAVNPVSGKHVSEFETPYPCRYANPGSSPAVCDHPHTVQWESERLLGDGDPTILRTESVRDLGGNPETVVTLRGNFKLRRAICRAPKPVFQRPCGPVPRASYAWLVGDAGYAVTTESQVAAIDSARRVSSRFSIFPDFAYSGILCGIASVGDAACSTKVIAPRTILFQARWPVSVPAGTHPTRGGWIVALDRNDHVRSIRQFGDLPPQLSAAVSS